MLTLANYFSSARELIHLIETHIMVEETVELFIKMQWWILSSALGHTIWFAMVPGTLYVLI